MKVETYTDGSNVYYVLETELTKALALAPGKLIDTKIQFDPNGENTLILKTREDVTFTSKDVVLSSQPTAKST